MLFFFTKLVPYSAQTILMR